MKWLFLLIPVGIVGLIIGISAYLQPNSFIGCPPQPVKNSPNCSSADAIVVVSGGNTQARTAAGIELYQNGWANALVLSGAAQDPMSQSNAAAMRTQALDAGVPLSAILIDEYARTTQQNAENTQTIFQEHDFKKVILVTSGYHQRRASLEFEKRSSDIIIRNYPVTQDGDWSWYWWLTPRGWWLAGGEIAKIVAFYFGASS